LVEQFLTHNRFVKSVQENIIADLRKRGFDLISVSEPDLCSNDPSRVLMRQIFGSIAQYDRAMTVAKLRGARERMRAKTGRCEGRKAYGNRPGESDIIDRMKVLRRGGMAVDKVAAVLNTEGAKPRAGQQWYPTTVYRILKATGAF
jgi:DNA invertase Pin-like site-specific DNA recombinase